MPVSKEKQIDLFHFSLPNKSRLKIHLKKKTFLNYILEDIYNGDSYKRDNVYGLILPL